MNSTFGGEVELQLSVASLIFGDIRGDPNYRQLSFELDTSIKGNSNKGHEFSDVKGKGVIGRKLSEQERYQLIEYLKDIRTVSN